MMTLKLWRALNNPPATHPIFVRTVLLPRISKRRSLSSVSFLIGFITSMSAFMPTLLIFMMPFLLGGCGLIYGLDCAVRVSQHIYLERKNKTYELLILCPQGELAACWVICTSSLYQQAYFRRLEEIVRTSVQIALVIISLLLGIFILISSSVIFSSSQLMIPIIVPLINAGAITILIYSEYAQSTVIGCLIGLTLPTFANDLLEPFLVAPAVFFLLKIGSYTASLLLGYNLLDKIYQHFGMQGGITDILLTLIRLVIIITVQDVVIHLMWHIVVRRTGTLPQDEESVLYPQG